MFRAESAVLDAGTMKHMPSGRAADGRAFVHKGFNASAFYEVLAERVAARGMTWSALAKETGITSSTLSRMANGRGPDAATLALLAAWAGINPADFVVAPQMRERAHPVAAIGALLRSDPSLDGASARALETIVEIAYERFRQGYA